MRAIAAALLPFAVLALCSGAADATTGPLSVSGRHLIDPSGQPVFLNGEAAWSLAVAATDQDVEQYLQQRRSLGINALLINLIEHHFGGPRNRSGELPFVGKPFGQPNEAYFQHLDKVLSRATELGFIVLAFPAYLGYECGDEGWCAEVRATPAATLEAYGRFLGERYRSNPNLVWVHGGDADAKANAVERQVAAIAAGIRSAGARQLHTAHCARSSSARDCYDFLKPDFDAVYTKCDNVNGETHRAYTRTPVMPYVLIEAIYEREGADLHCLLAQFNATALGGGAGHFLGIYPLWMFSAGWQSYLRTPGILAIARSMAALRQAGIAQPSLVPQWTAAQAAQSGASRTRAPLVGQWARMPAANASVGYVGGLNVIGLPDAGRAAVCWFDVGDDAEPQAISGQTTAADRKYSPPRPGLWLYMHAPAGAFQCNAPERGTTAVPAVPAGPQ